MLVISSASGVRRVFLASAAAFLLIAPFPSSAGWRVFFLLSAFAALLWEARPQGQSLELRKLPRALVVAALAWFALCVASLAWSVDPGYTLQEIRRELLYGAIAFVVFFVGSREPAYLHLWVKTLLLGALILGVGEWLRLLLPTTTLLQKASMEPGPFSTHVLMVAPLLVIVVWPPPTGMGKSVALTVAAGVALVAAGLAGESRILWLALLIAVVVAFATFWMETPSHHPARNAAKRAFLIALALLTVLMAISAEYKLRYYPRAGTAMESLAYDERQFVWEAALRKVLEQPWLGHGYGREIVAKDIQRAMESSGSRNRLNHGHNVFLDAALQLGALGVIAFATLLGAVACALAALRRREGGTALAIAGLALLAGYLVKNLTDDFFFRPSSLVFWAIAGMLLGIGARAPAKP